MCLSFPAVSSKVAAVVVPSGAVVVAVNNVVLDTVQPEVIPDPPVRIFVPSDSEPSSKPDAGTSPPALMRNDAGIR
jgi:hypothetical protein